MKYDAENGITYTTTIVCNSDDGKTFWVWEQGDPKDRYKNPSLVSITQGPTGMSAVCKDV